MVYIIIHGIDYVSWPRLNPPTEVIYYNGPGYRSGHHGKGLNGKDEPAWKKTSWPVKISRRTKSLVDEVELGSVKKRVD